MESVDDKIISVMPKLKEVQKATGIRRIAIYLVKTYEYQGDTLKLKETKTKVYLKAPSKYKESVLKCDADFKAILGDAGITPSTFLKNCVSGYPLEIPGVFTDLRTMTQTELKHDPNKHTLFIFQAHNGQPCYKDTFSQLSSLLSKNPEVSKHFKVVLCISGEAGENIIKALPLKEDKSIHCYYLESFIGYGHLYEYFKRETRFGIVNKDGCLNVIIKLSRGQLIKYMERALKEEYLWQNKEAQLLKATNNLLLQKVEQFLQSKTCAIRDKFSAISFEMVTRKKFDLCNDSISERTPTLGLNAAAFTHTKELVKDIAEEFSKIFSKHTNLKIKLSTTKGSAVVWGSTCSKCGKSIDGQSQYKCVECCDPPFYLCNECGGKKGSVHPHLLFFVQEPPSVSQLSYTSVRTKTTTDFHDKECKACRQKIVSTGWACLNCEAIYLCNICFLATRERESEGYKKLKSELESHGHFIKEHVYQRFNTND